MKKAKIEEEKKKAEAERKRKEQEAIEAKLKDEKMIKQNEALGDEGMSYLQNMAQTHDKEKAEKEKKEQE